MDYGGRSVFISVGEKRMIIVVGRDILLVLNKVLLIVVEDTILESLVVTRLTQ